MNHNHISDNVASFIGGSTLVGFSSHKFILGDILPTGFYSDLTGKIVITIVISILGGLIGLGMKDIYNIVLQPAFKRVLRRIKKRWEQEDKPNE